MLLSDETVKHFINSDLVACWVSVRPAPKLSIDFGDGRKLERTLRGNTAISLCTSDGKVVDVFPGVYTPEDFLSEIKPALELLAGDPNPSASTLQAFHVARLAERPRVDRGFALSKTSVESPILYGLGRRSTAPWPWAVIPSGARLFSPRNSFDRISARLVDLSHTGRSPADIRGRIGVATAETTTPQERGRKAIEIDSKTNVEIARQAVHNLLGSKSTLQTPAMLRKPIFKDILKIDYDDPYLGLTDILLPGTSGK